MVADTFSRERMPSQKHRVRWKLARTKQAMYIHAKHSRDACMAETQAKVAWGSQAQRGFDAALWVTQLAHFQLVCTIQEIRIVT